MSTCEAWRWQRRRCGRKRYIDREFSWLAFNTRVLELAEDPDVPLLERAKFLAIFASNLDEFFMVRVRSQAPHRGRGRRQSRERPAPREVHEGTLTLTRELMTRQANCFHNDVLPALVKEGIEISRWDDLDDSEHNRLRELFGERIFPVLTPLAVDPAHPFPYISGLSLNLAVVLRNPRTATEHFARVKVPPNFPGSCRSPSSGSYLSRT